MWIGFRKLVLAGSLTVLASTAAGAQSQHLTLGDLYREVARANPRIAAAKGLARAADARVPGARRPPDPQVQLGLMNYAVPAFAPMPQFGMTQLQVMQMLPLGGKLGLAGQVAAGRASASAHRATEVAWEVRTRVAMAFYDRYATDRALDVDRETIRLLEDIEKTAASMYRVGEGRQADVLRAQVEIARMSEDTLRMRAMQTVMSARLNALLDRRADSLPGAPRLPAFPDSIPALRSLDDVAATARPMIRAGIDEVAVAAAGERLARKEIWPDLQLGVQYGQRGGDMGTERMMSFMVGASVPVFARDRQYRMRDETAAMRAMADADLAAMRAETRARLAEAHAALTRARNLAALYRSTILPQAEATVSSALAAYRVGTVDFMTLLDARMAVNKYRKELDALGAEEGKAWADLEMLTGRELVDLTASKQEGAR